MTISHRSIRLRFVTTLCSGHALFKFVYKDELIDQQQENSLIFSFFKFHSPTKKEETSKQSSEN